MFCVPFMKLYVLNEKNILSISWYIAWLKNKGGAQLERGPQFETKQYALMSTISLFYIFIDIIYLFQNSTRFPQK